MFMSGTIILMQTYETTDDSFPSSKIVISDKIAPMQNDVTKGGWYHP